MIKQYNSILEINHEYKGLILDVWGVLHSSGIAFEGVLQNLTTLKKQGKKILLLSNAPRRASFVQTFLENSPKIFKGEHFDDIITSGEVFYLEAKAFSGKKALYIGPEKDKPTFNGLNINLVDSMSYNPEVALITGYINNFDEIAPKMMQNKIPLYCLNPDIFITKQDGSTEECAGFLAEKYKEIGGEVIYFGKPYKQIYLKAMDFFKNTDKTDIIAVGDGMETDILGASNFGLKNALCLAGLPSIELKRGVSIEDYLSKFDAKPDFIIKSL